MKFFVRQTNDQFHVENLFISHAYNSCSYPETPRNKSSFHYLLAIIITRDRRLCAGHSVNKIITKFKINITKTVLVVASVVSWFLSGNEEHFLGFADCLILALQTLLRKVSKERKRSLINLRFYRKIHCLTREFHVKFHAKNRYRTNREAMSAISVFRVKFNVEFTSQAVNFS